MIPPLPRIVHQPEYRDHWHWGETEWYPIANEDAPQELKDELDKWRKDIEDAERNLSV